MEEPCYCNLCIKGEDSISYFVDVTDNCTNFLCLFTSNLKEVIYEGENSLQQKFVDVSKLVYYLNKDNWEIGPQFLITIKTLVTWLNKHNPHIKLHKESINGTCSYYILGYSPIYDATSYENNYIHFEEYFLQNVKECNVCNEVGFIKQCKNDKCKYNTCMDCYSKIPRRPNFSCPGCRTSYYMPEI
jgi:hypothetical protein